MEKINQGHPMSQSPDFVKDNIELLKSLFPTIVKEGKIVMEELEALLGEDVEKEEEYYNFTWAGKSMARREANKPSTATLRPDKSESKDWDTTGNVFIEGDNLEVLKLLQKSYANKIKLIYIDPPYNTGKDFVYKDNYNDNLNNYLSLTGQLDEDGKKISTNSESDGRYHSNWLNMIYPRLKLARNLLQDNGAIFISIDDNELSNLTKATSEVFGEENIVGNIIWRKKYGIQNDAKYFSTSHEYLLVVAKNKSLFSPNLLERSEEQNNRYKNPDNDPRGPWKPGDLSVGRVTDKDIYEIVTPSGRKVLPPEGNSWRFSKEKFEEYKNDNRIWFGTDGSNVPAIKRFLSEVKQGITPTTFWDYDEVGHTDGSNKALKQLFGNKAYFDYPKPVELIKKVLKIGIEEGIILDFFAGSGTTAHATMDLNSIDGKKRKFICVQLPEPLSSSTEGFKSGFKSIADITKERIRRAGEKIKSEQKSDIDIGFKVFKLDSSNIRTWDGNPEKLEENLFTAGKNIKEDRTEEDVLFEILLKYGLDLTVPIEEKSVNGKMVYSVGYGTLFICLSDNITTEVAEAIGQWKEKLEPPTSRVIFKDSGFNDVQKTNSIQILKRFGIIEVNTI